MIYSSWKYDKIFFCKAKNVLRNDNKLIQRKFTFLSGAHHCAFVSLFCQSRCRNSLTGLFPFTAVFSHPNCFSSFPFFLPLFFRKQRLSAILTFAPLYLMLPTYETNFPQQCSKITVKSQLLYNSNSMLDFTCSTCGRNNSWE